MVLQRLEEILGDSDPGPPPIGTTQRRFIYDPIDQIYNKARKDDKGEFKRVPPQQRDRRGKTVTGRRKEQEIHTRLKEESDAVSIVTTIREKLTEKLGTNILITELADLLLELHVRLQIIYSWKRMKIPKQLELTTISDEKKGLAATLLDHNRSQGIRGNIEITGRECRLTVEIIKLVKIGIERVEDIEHDYAIEAVLEL